MKGLLIKDFFCLKKHLVNYAFVIVGVIFMSVSCVLSFNYGNVHTELIKLVESGESTQEGVMQLVTLSMLLIMSIPFVAAGDATANLISDDEKAGFYKVESALPVSIRKRVICRFLTGYLFIAAGAVVDFLMIIVISALTTVISFGNFCGVIITVSSLMMVYISLLILLVYIMGKKSVVYAEIIPLLIGVAAYVLANLDKIKAFLIESDDSAFTSLYDRTTKFIFCKSYIIFIAAVIISAAACAMAVHVAKRKRGVA